MNKIKNLKGECIECGGSLEFPAESIGTTVECRHCRKTTELSLAGPKEEPTVSTRVIAWTLIALFILIGGLVGSLIALNRAQNWAQKQHGTEGSGSRAPATNSLRGRKSP